VVLYDHLVPARLLRYARPDAEKIDVGVASPRTAEQDAICYLLVEKAREGKVVARLKWGDPFVFDRGATEAMFLHEQGVSFDVVPGVPAGIAIPSYAGVPITYPGAGDTLTFVRGHEDEGRTQTSIDWKSLANLDGTIVCYAGPQQLPDILAALLANGRSPDDDAAIVYDGTLPTQQTHAGSLQKLAEFDARPLFGRRVLVTRPKEQARELVERLEAMGAEAIEAPMIRIVPPDDYGPLDEALARIDQFDWVIFTSANAVAAFVERLLAGPQDLRALKGVKICVVGPATGDRLAAYGLKVDLTPGEYRADAVVRALTEFTDVRGRKILLPHADIGREVLADELRRHGAEITEVVAYRTVGTDADREGEPDVYRMLLERRIDVVTFTSASAVRHFVRIVGAEPAADLLATTAVAAIGPVTADAAALHNIRPTIVPQDYTIPALVDAIVRHFSQVTEAH